LRSSGRCHRGLDLFAADEVFAALYASLAPEIAVWEMVRRSAARNLGYLRNNVLTELEVDLGSVLNLSDPGVVGVTRAQLTGPDHTVCQELAAAALARDVHGLLVPSAALPGSNLVLLPQNLPERPPIRAIRSTELPLDAVAAERLEQE
jgi:RES domain-containing protein